MSNLKTPDEVLGPVFFSVGAKAVVEGDAVQALRSDVLMMLRGAEAEFRFWYMEFYRHRDFRSNQSASFTSGALRQAIRQAKSFSLIDNEAAGHYDVFFEEVHAWAPGDASAIATVHGMGKLIGNEGCGAC